MQAVGLRLIDAVEGLSCRDIERLVGLPIAGQLLPTPT
jgi:hypothetical protein